MIEFQVTLFAQNGKYRPVSAIVKLPADTEKKVIIAEGVKKICMKRLWQKKDLLTYTYTKAKVRQYHADSGALS